MANVNDEYRLNRSQQAPVFRKRIDENKRAHQLSDKQYAASALNYPDRGFEQQNNSQRHHRHVDQVPFDMKKDGHARWNQNYSTQDIYLGYCVAEGLFVDILMKNDSTRTGRIESYDNWSLLVTYEGKKSLLFKSGVMAITVSDRNETGKNQDYMGGRRLSDFSSEYSHNPA